MSDQGQACTDHGRAYQRLPLQIDSFRKDTSQYAESQKAFFLLVLLKRSQKGFPFFFLHS